MTNERLAEIRDILHGSVIPPSGWFGDAGRELLAALDQEREKVRVISLAMRSIEAATDLETARRRASQALAATKDAADGQGPA